MPPIVIERVAWSVGLSVGLSLCHLVSPTKTAGLSNRDAVCVEDKGGPREPLTRYSRALPDEYCIVGILHITAI